jgi:hypothetical protein
MTFTIAKYRYTTNLTALALLVMLFAYPAATSQVLAMTIDGQNIQDIFCFVTSSGKASELKTFDVRDPYQVPVTEKTTTKGHSTSHDDSETEGHNKK